MPKLLSKEIVPNTIDCNRRRTLAMLGMVASAVATGLAGPALAKPSMSVARAGAWFLGGRLSIATNVYFRTPNGDYDKFLREAKGVSTDLGVTIPPLPSRPTVSSDGLIKYLGYFNQGDGAKIKAQLASAWGPEHATLYQIAVRLFQLSLLYDLDPKLGDKVAGAIAGDCERVGLPNELWRPPIDAVAKRENADAVKKKAIEAYFDVQKFLLKGTGGR